ncbi:MAG: XTP/dITP diphosphohydrolase [Lentimonas sp.]|jgi:XTP/dITP diphosphohydrolase
MTLKIDQILIASGNKGKIYEISQLLKEVNIKAISAAEFNIQEPEENGKSFEENSQIKAKYYAQETGLTSLADDSGLCVDLLDGQPGIYSADWAIDEKTKTRRFDLAFERIKQKLIEKGVDIEKQTINAHFICNLSLFNPKNNQISSFEGRVDGKIILPAKGEKGFGYDPIFIANSMDKTFGEVFPEEKDAISHRTQAFLQLKSFLTPPPKDIKTPLLPNGKNPV